jgi:hypothetical protein
MQQVEPAQLTMNEQEELLDHEAIIEQSQAVFVEVGNALMAIRDERLYRATHDSFEAYLHDRWPAISKRRGYQLIDSAQIAKVVPITNERQGRALKGVPPEQAKAAFEAASVATNGAPTAKAISQAVDSLRLPPDFAAYEAKALACNLRLIRDGEYYVTGMPDGPRISSQWSVIKSFLDTHEQAYQEKARAAAHVAQPATVAPQPEPWTPPERNQEIATARGYQTRLSIGNHDLSTAKARQQVRQIAGDLLSCLERIDGLPTVFDKAVEAVLTSAADLMTDANYQALVKRLDGVVTQ